MTLYKSNIDGVAAQQITDTTGFLPDNVGVLLPMTISHDEQMKIIQQAIIRGTMRGPLAHDDTWKSWDCRVPVKPLPTGIPTFWFRMDDDVEWTWQEGTEIVQSVLARLNGLYRRLTKVAVYVTMPGKSVALHREPVAGCNYGDGDPFFAESRPDAPLSITHAVQRCFNFRIPLTEIEGDNGMPVFDINGRLYRYNVGNNFFALNEMDVRHGALPVGHWRGVVHLSGEIDMDILDSLPLGKIPATYLKDAA